MPLRTMIERLRARDWTSFVIEIFIVVIGVFIGLQVSNWNDDRKDSRRGVESLQRIQVDLQKDRAELEKVAAFWTKVNAYGVAAVNYAETGQLVEGSAWKTLLAYYQSSQLWPYRQVNITFKEIQSTGDLALIRNAKLRARISGHYDDSGGSQVTEVFNLLPVYRERVRGMTPWPIQQYIWANCYYSGEQSNQQLIDCPSPVSEPEAAAVIEKYRADPELSGQLRFWLANTSAGLILMKNVSADSQLLTQEIQAELKR